MRTPRLAFMAFSACVPPPTPLTLPTARTSGITLDVTFLREQTRILSADDMEGRRPGTPGARKAVAHIVEMMRAIGLEPAGDAGSYEQRVPMRAVATDYDATDLTVSDRPLAAFDQWVGTTLGPGEHTFDAPLVFAGYGVTAPEFQWEDYDIDVRDKVVLVLVGDPPVGDGRFAGDAMTYYGRWSYKFERALAAGAAGCLVIHQTEAASYGWNVPRTSYGGERFQVVEADGSLPPALGLEGWITSDAADAIARDAGASLAAWRDAALRPDFVPVELRARLGGTLRTRQRRVEDVNVLGRLSGTDRADEAVIVTAHWDHLGRRDGGPGEDVIFNGAIDNASGVAAMLGVAGELRRRADAGGPSRSIVFFATTAEEQGLLGARYYAAHPLIPPARIAAVVNLDSMNVHGRTRGVEVVGLGQTTLEDVLGEVVAAQGRVLLPDRKPSAGSYYRSDHFPFVAIGVPALYFHGGGEFVGVDAASTARIHAENEARYHTERDELRDEWSFEGALEDARAVVEVLWRVANDPERPHFRPASEFASIERGEPDQP